MFGVSKAEHASSAGQTLKLHMMEEVVVVVGGGGGGGTIGFLFRVGKQAVEFLCTG